MSTDSISSGFLQLGTHRHVLAAGALLIFWIAEAWVPLHPGRNRAISHAAANLGLALINAALLQGLAVGFIWVAGYSQSHSIALLHLWKLPGWLNLLLAILLIDAWQYAWHRLNHRVPWLWRFHSVHHSDAEMDATSAFRFHTGEMTASILARMVVVSLLGITVPQWLLYEALSLPIILFHHSNIRLAERWDRWLRIWIVTPGMHQVHHSQWQPETDSNYASFLSVWDRLFGSFRLRPNLKSIQLGLEGSDEKEWRMLPGMLVAPFKKRRTD